MRNCFQGRRVYMQASYFFYSFLFFSFFLPFFLFFFSCLVIIVLFCLFTIYCRFYSGLFSFFFFLLAFFPFLFLLAVSAAPSRAYSLSLHTDKLMMKNCFWPFSSPWFDSRIASWDLWRNKEEWRTGCQREILVFDHKIWYICSGLLQYEDQRWVLSVMSVIYNRRLIKLVNFFDISSRCIAD